MKSNPPVPPRRSFSISSESGKASLPGTASPFGTAAEWRSALDAGRVSSEALVRAHLDRIAAFNPQLNAIVALDSEAALTAARTFDAGGGNCGPLSGIPMTVKDSLEVSGFTAVCGAPALKDHRPRVDATAVARLRGAGAIILGKTNVPLYASDYQTFNEVFGTTANPYALDRTPGGSSGGAAAALAAGLTPVELGTDLAGSLRIPAHACGVASLKPSFGVVPLAGSLCAPPGRYRPRDLWVVGPMARSVADLRLLYDIIADPVPDAAAAPRRWRVALWADDPFCPTDPVVGEALETAARALAATGRVDVTEAWPDAGSEEFFLTHCRLMYAEMAGGLPDDVASYFARRAARLKGTPDLANITDLMAAGLTQSLQDREAAVRAMERFRAVWARFFLEYDAVLCPAAPTVAPLHDQRRLDQRTAMLGGRERPALIASFWAAHASSCYLPAVTVPVGQDADGMPVGAQLVGPYRSDRRLLALAGELESVAGGFRPPPLTEQGFRRSAHP